jgi:adenylate cyclase, class 2
MTNSANREFEVRFLEINKEDIIAKLKVLKARDLGGDLLHEIIFYDKNKDWLKEKKIVRIRQSNSGVTLCFKHTEKAEVGGTKEVEIEINNIDKAKEILENMGLVAFRTQEKKRHTYLFDSVSVSIDEHPKVPPYLEIEGYSEIVLRDAARALELDWKDAHIESSRDFIEQVYKIPLTSLKTYTFDKIE